MKYLLLIYGDEARWEVFCTGAEFLRELRESGELVSVEGLADAVTARLVRVKDGVRVVGPAPRAGLAGYLVVDCEDLDRAMELAARYPAAHTAGVGVWPLMQHTGTEM